MNQGFNRDNEIAILDNYILITEALWEATNPQPLEKEQDEKSS